MNPAKQYDKRELRIKQLEAEMRRIRNENLSLLTQPPGQGDQRGEVLAYLKTEVITLKRNIMELVAQNKELREKLSDAERQLKIAMSNQPTQETIAHGPADTRPSEDGADRTSSPPVPGDPPRVACE